MEGREGERNKIDVGLCACEANEPKHQRKHHEEHCSRNHGRAARCAQRTMQHVTCYSVRLPTVHNELLKRVASSRDVGSFFNRCQSARDQCCHHDKDGNADEEKGGGGEEEDDEVEDDDDDSDAKLESSGVGCAAPEGGLSKKEVEGGERDCRLR